MDGFVFLNKNIDITSRGVSNEVSLLLNEKKVGHIGTLDPFATGLLIIAVGKATRCSQFFEDFSKGYIATLTLGEERDSLDITGKVIETKEVPNLSKREIEDALNSFLGKQLQTPPMTSAVHVNGKKLYTLAHKGIEIDRPSREIEVFNIKFLSYEDNKIIFYTNVSKGTYIRVLGSDIAKKLGTVGYLSALKRVEVGPFKVDDAILLDEIKEESIISIYNVLSSFCYIKEVDDNLGLDIKNGKIKYLNENHNEKYLLVVDKNKNIIAMYVKNLENNYEFRRGLFA